MATFPGTPGDDTLTAVAGDDTYQLGAGNDTLIFNATIDGLGVLTWNNGFDTVIPADGGVEAPNYDRIVINFSYDYVWERKVGNDLEVSIYAHKLTGETDPGATDQVGKIIVRDAFTASLASRISRIEGTDFSIDAIAAPVVDSYGHTAIYTVRFPGSGSVAYEYKDWYHDINYNYTGGLQKFTSGRAISYYFDADSNEPWEEIAVTYGNYGTGNQAIVDTVQFNDDGSQFFTGGGSSDSFSGTGENDILDGRGGADVLDGEGGDDTLLGGAGRDYLIGGAGDDTLDGGEILDRVNFSDLNVADYSANLGIVADLEYSVAQDGLGSTDTLININSIVGSNYADRIFGSTFANLFELFQGLKGNDTIDGGANMASSANQASYSRAPAAVNVNLSTGQASDGYGSVDTLINISQIVGSAFGDVLTGTNATAYTEIFDGGVGNDTIDGLGGIDTLRFDSAFSGVTVDLATGTVSDGRSGTDTVRNIENARGTFANDRLTGDAGNNNLDGQGGDDTLAGGAGNDTLTPGQGNDSVDGGAGVDTVILSMFPNVFSLNEPTPGRVTGSYGVVTPDTLVLEGIEFAQFGTHFQTTIPMSTLVSGAAQLQLGRLTDLYLAFFGRAPDVSGLEYWQERLLEEGRDFATISKDFAWSTEAQALFPPAASNRAFVQTVYVNCFGRQPDPGGWDYWTGKLDGLGVTDLSDRGAFVGEVILGAYAPSSGAEDRALLTNRHEAAMYYVNKLSNTPAEGFDAAINTLLTRVTGDASTEDNAEIVIDYTFANPITLTGMMNDPVLLDSIWNA